MVKIIKMYFKVCLDPSGHYMFILYKAIFGTELLVEE